MGMFATATRETAALCAQWTMPDLTGHVRTHGMQHLQGHDNKLQTCKLRADKCQYCVVRLRAWRKAPWRRSGHLTQGRCTNGRWGWRTFEATAAAPPPRSEMPLGVPNVDLGVVASGPVGVAPAVLGCRSGMDSSGGPRVVAAAGRGGGVDAAALPFVDLVGTCELVGAAGSRGVLAGGCCAARAGALFGAGDPPRPDMPSEPKNSFRASAKSSCPKKPESTPPLMAKAFMKASLTTV